MRTCHISVLSFVCALALPAFSAAQSQIDLDRDFLSRYGKMAVDDGSLVKLLKKRAECEDPRQVQLLVQQLGSQNFLQRDYAFKTLIQVGHISLPHLAKRTLDPDVELARRVKECVKEIEGEPHVDWYAPCVRLLVAKKPAGAMEALLAFLPLANDRRVEEEIYFGLDEMVAETKFVPASLMDALGDENALRRAAAACIVGRRGNPDQQVKVHKVMNMDQDPLVRLRAAQGLLGTRDKSAIPVLIDLLRQPSVTVGWQAQELLLWCAKEQSPQDLLGAGSDQERTRCQDAWQKWWARHQVGLKIIVNSSEYPEPSLTVAFGPRLQNGTWSDCIWLIGYDGSVRFEINMNDRLTSIVELMNGRFLTIRRSLRASQGGHVEFRDLSGELIKHFTVEISPDRWRRRTDGHWDFMQGNWLISCDPDGRLTRAKSYRRANALGGWNDDGIEMHFRDGSRTVSGMNNDMREIGNRVRRDHPDGRVSWEAYLDCESVRTTVPFPLLGFGHISKVDLNTLDSRLKNLSHANVMRRRHATIELRPHATKAAVFSAAVKSFDDQDAFVRSQAIFLAAQSPELCEKAIPQLIKLLDKGPDTYLFYAFSKLNPEKSIPALLAAYRDDREPHSQTRRGMAIYVLGREYLGAHPDVVSTVRSAAVDKDPELRKRVYLAIAGSAKSELLLDLLRRAIQEDEIPIATEALVCLARLGTKADMEVTAILKAAERPQLRATIAAALAHVGRTSPAARKWLLKCVAEENDPFVVGMAAASIGRRLDADPELAQTLIKTLEKWIEHRPVRLHIVKALGDLGPHSKESLPSLTKLALEKPTPVDVPQILKSIEQIDRETFEQTKAIIQQFSIRGSFPQKDRE